MLLDRVNPAMNEKTNMTGNEILIVGLNWLGDSITAMPAIQAYKKALPGKRLVMLVKPQLAGLWPLHPAIAETLTCAGSVPEMLRTAALIRARRFEAAFILPQSFRSALIPFLGRVPRRTGLKGHCRRWLLTDPVSPPQGPDKIHQEHEYGAIFGQAVPAEEEPRLSLDPVLVEKARATLGAGREIRIGLIPGAARGAAKRWPEEYFSALGKILLQKLPCQILVFGSAADTELGARVCADIGSAGRNHAGNAINHAKSVVNLAGRTPLPEFAAFLSLCSVVAGNDSGGAHLAAAAGAAVVVIFGLTDPAKTKPLGRKVAVLQESSLRSRDVPRQSARAEASLKKISPELAAEKVIGLINK